MTRIITATDAKNRLGSLFKDLDSSDEVIVIESRGKTQAILLSPRRYRDFLILDYEQRRLEAIAKIEEIEAAVAARGNDLDEDEALELSVQIVREIRADKALEELRRMGDER